MSDLYVSDSLGVGTKDYLKRVHANVRGGRPSSEGLDIVRNSKGRYGRLIFDLGTNDGSVANLKQSVRGVRKAAKGKEIIMSTINGPDAKRKNKYLRRLNRKGKITLVSMKGVELSGDGIHATPKGYKQRARRLNMARRGATVRPQKVRPVKPDSVTQSTGVGALGRLQTAPQSAPVDFRAELRKKRARDAKVSAVRNA